MSNLIERLEAGEEVECYVADNHTALDGQVDYSKGKTALITRHRTCSRYPFGGASFGDIYRYAKPMYTTMEDYQEAIEQHHSLEPAHTARGLPTDAKERKAIPVYSGFINYFPKAIAAVAKLSLRSCAQHGQTAETMHWDRSKSGDELDAMMRHILDGDWEQVAWRAMANLEKKLEENV
jgi:hypothetical protein